MALGRLRLPSFTLVLTAGPHSFHEYPTAIKLDSSASPAMLPTAQDHLMKTIDLRGKPDDSIQNPVNRHDYYGRMRLHTIFEEEEPSPAVDKQAVRSTGQYVLKLLQSLRRKLYSAKNTGAVPLRLATN